MDSRKIALQETKTIAIGVAVGVALMIGVFALLGKYDTPVLLGGITGGALAVLHFFSLAVVTTLAADRAEGGDPQAGVKLVQGSYPIRMLALAAALFLCAKSGCFNVVALALPLAFVRPTITFAEFFRKKGE